MIRPTTQGVAGIDRHTLVGLDSSGARESSNCDNSLSQLFRNSFVSLGFQEFSLLNDNLRQLHYVHTI